MGYFVVQAPDLREQYIDIAKLVPS